MLKYFDENIKISEIIQIASFALMQQTSQEKLDKCVNIIYTVSLEYNTDYVVYSIWAVEHRAHTRKCHTIIIM